MTQEICFFVASARSELAKEAKSIYYLRNEILILVASAFKFNVYIIQSLVIIANQMLLSKKF